MTVQIGPGPVPRTIDQTSDLALTAATHSSIPGLAFEAVAATLYVVEGIITATAAGASQDVQASVSGVTDLTGEWTWWTQPVTDEAFIPSAAGEILAAGAITESAVTDIAATTDIGYITFAGVISSAAGGVFQLAAGQGTDAGTTTVTHSRMLVRQYQA